MLSPDGKPRHELAQAKPLRLCTRLGSYGGEDSPSDISRVRTHLRYTSVNLLSNHIAAAAGAIGSVRWRGGLDPPPQAVREVQDQDHVVHTV